MNNDFIFDNLKNELLNNTRLLKRFYEFCLSYQNFEFDELGINIDEAENEKRKALKIKDKLLSEVNKNLNYTIKDNITDVLKNEIKLVLEYNINESKKTVKFALRVEEDNFTLEITKLN